MRQALESTSTINTQGNLNVERIGSLLAPIPPTPEQRVICALVEEQTREYTQINARIQQQIEKLHEYRQALISAAVTGKIDVT